MGVLRLLFALSILIFHSGQFFGYNVTTWSNALFSFFIISGFYMALILDKKYPHKKHRLLFWSNRFLRIFPLYWVTLVLTFLFAVLKLVFHIGTQDNAILHYLQWSPHTSPITFGLNLFNYISRNITLILTFDYVRVSDNIPGYLLVQQAWSLQIELLFYLMAPFLAVLSKKRFLMVFVGYMVVFWGFIAPLHNLTLESTLFYALFHNLLFFLLGMMSYRFLYKNLQRISIHPYIPQAIFLIFLIYLLLYNILPFKFTLPLFDIADPFYYVALVLSLPLIFLQTSASIFDNFIGKLSYPVYVLHFFVIKLFSNIPYFKPDSNLKTILVILTTLGISYLAIRFIEAPIDRFRQKRAKALVLAKELAE